jgi:hypothetical protein
VKIRRAGSDFFRRNTCGTWPLGDRALYRAKHTGRNRVVAENELDRERAAG